MNERYPGQTDNEVVQIVIHKHVMAVLPFVLVGVGVFLVGLVMVYAGAAGIIGLPRTDNLGVQYTPVTIPAVPIGLFLVVLSMVLLFGALYVWWQNKMFITDEHIVDMDQLGLFQRTISTLRLSRVQDISVRVKGPIQTLMQYGTITIQTAGEKELFHFDYVPQPYRVKSEIVTIYEKFAETKPVEADGLRHPEPDVDNDNTWHAPKK